MDLTKFGLFLFPVLSTGYAIWAILDIVASVIRFRSKWGPDKELERQAMKTVILIIMINVALWCFIYSLGEYVW